MADRSISISLEARVQGFVSGLRTAQQATTDFADRTAAFARDNEQHLDRVGKASMVLGGAILAGLGLAIKSFAEFDSAMSEVEASTHETAGNMELLREAAINAGADTAFSAKEAAQGIDELAKAGVSTKDILNGGLTGALSLAAAGSLGVAEAAEIAATALTQFKLSGDKVPHLADLLAAGAGKAQGSVQDMGAALKQAGLVAASTGLSIEETTGGLAAFASAGLIGSDAGTSFKSMLQRLTPQSLEAKNKMAELGISAYDAQGQFIGLSKFSENLKTSMKDLTPEARNAAMGVIFGSDAVRAANVLYEQGGTGIADWTAKVNDAGFAAVTASIKQDNLAGDIEKLGGSFDSLLIKSGGGLAESLRGIVQGVEDMVDAFGKIPTPVLNAGLGIAGIVGGAALLGGALMTALPKVMEFRASMTALATAAPPAATGIAKVGKAAGVAAAAMVVLQIAGAIFSDKEKKSAEEYGQALLKVANSGKEVNASGLDSVFQGWGKNFGVESVSNVNSMADAVREFANQDLNDQINKNFADPLSSFFGFAKSHAGQITDSFKDLGDALGNLVKSGSADTAAKSFQALTAEFEKNGKGAKEALESVPGYETALKGLGVEAGVVLEGQDLLDFAMGKIPASMQAAAGATETYTTAAGQSAPVTEDMAKALDDVGLSASGAIVNLANFAQSLMNAGLLQLSARDAARGFQDAIDKVSDSIATNGTSLDIHTEKGRANEAALDAIAQAGINVVKSNAENGASQEVLQGNLTETYNALIAGAGQFNITGQAAIDLARDVLKIPPGVTIEAWMADHASTTLDSIKGKAEGLDGKRATITIGVNTVYTETGPKPDGYVAKNGIPAFNATGGRVNYLAGGGKPNLYDMSPRGTDTIPTMLTPGEFVVNAASTAKNLHTLEAINAGYKFAPASAPARQMAMTGPPSDSGPAQMTGTLTLSTGEVLGVFRGVAEKVVSGALSSASRGSSYQRGGV